MTCTFSPEQITALAAPLDRAKVRQREQGRSSVSYLEGWQFLCFAHTMGAADQAGAQGNGQHTRQRHAVNRSLAYACRQTAP
jgi:hypothetical protein